MKGKKEDFGAFLFLQGMGPLFGKTQHYTLTVNAGTNQWTLDSSRLKLHKGFKKGNFYQSIHQKKKSRGFVLVVIKFPDGRTYQGRGVITFFYKETDHKNRYVISLEGKEKIEMLTQEEEGV